MLAGIIARPRATSLRTSSGASSIRGSPGASASPMPAMTSRIEGAALSRRALLAAERGTLFKEAETRIALVYPSPYRAAMSSLGYQQIYRALHALPGVAADRAMLPDAQALGDEVTRPPQYQRVSPALWQAAAQRA